jgi:hypothetical protein
MAVARALFGQDLPKPQPTGRGRGFGTRKIDAIVVSIPELLHLR